MPLLRRVSPQALLSFPDYAAFDRLLRLMQVSRRFMKGPVFAGALKYIYRLRTSAFGEGRKQAKKQQLGVGMAAHLTAWAALWAALQ